MPRMTAQEAGRKGGKVGGKSRSAAKLAACKKNGFQKTAPAPAAPAPAELPCARPTGLLLTTPKEGQ
jgi:hypothetical protein